ncbi:MAG TPA: DUF748 domain-containing protein [Candidatus Limnocylindrales bacterium]|nr:DUF748 domain-containing protein [Candidatus Limnocylindrales bacterium]
MKLRHQSSLASRWSEPRGSSEKEPKPKRVRSHRWRTIGLIAAILLVVCVVVRALLPWVVRDYVNRTLDRSILYSGKIGDVQIHLWRGAYSIHDVRISKTTGNVPVPFFEAKTVDFAVQWDALLHGKIVGRLVIDQPELNFVDAPSSSEAQTGAGGPWLQMIRDLFPFKINSARINQGTVHFRAYITKNPVDVFLSQVEASIDNLTNIRDETRPLISTVQAAGLVMGEAKLEYKMTFDPFSYRPTFHMALRLLGLDVTKINDLALAYGKFDFKRGWFDLVVESTAREGQLTGYAKPLFRNLKVFSLAADVKEDNVLQFFWQALVGATTSLFKNQPRDQFGTLIPFTGDLSTSTTANILATVGNLLRNAFVRAYLPQLQSGQENLEGLQFEAPDITSSVSEGASP